MLSDTNKLQLSLRSAKKEDLAEIMEIARKAFTSDSCEPEKVYSERLEIFSDGFALLLDNNKIIGFLCSELWQYEEDPKIENFYRNHSPKTMHQVNGTELFIDSMAIIPEYRGKQIGHYLFETFLKYIGQEYKLKSAILVITEEWANAKKIYLANDFHKIKTINNYITENGIPRSGIILRKYF